MGSGTNCVKSIVLPVAPGATYVVTGGLSGLGAAFAEHLAASGARHLALVSRRGTAALEAPALLDRLAALGAEARCALLDAVPTVRGGRAPDGSWR
jgi:NAD(P)-dependent dehydrogenase (short-subunit alcohol dehydrogenase family)